MNEPHALDALEALRRVRSGTLTAEALVRSALERIEAREETVQAWAWLDGASALDAARALDASRGTRVPGVLEGIPVGLKDIIDTEDMPTGYGSPIYPDHRPVADAAAAALIRNAGGVFPGKTVTTEFAFLNPGKTRNPHDPAHTPGGSSSGSAAAVAECMVPLALGTQTGGSVIRPASFCGVVGYKPTFGTFSYAGVKLLAGSLDTLGAFSRRVEDLALVRSALLGIPLDASAPVPRPSSAPRIGLCPTPWQGQLEPGTLPILEQAAERLAAAGARVQGCTLPAGAEELVEANQVLMAFEGVRSLAWERRRHPERLSPKLAALLEEGARIPHERYLWARRLQERLRRESDAWLGGLDALLVPSAPGEAPRSLDTTGDPVFNRAWTTLGLPCITLPGMTGPRGLPVGVQLVGAWGEDEALLGTAAWAEPHLQA